MDNYKKDGEGRQDRRDYGHSNDSRSYSADGRKLRPRKKVSFGAGDGERKSYGEHRDGERRSYNGGERRPYRAQGDRPYGERRSYNGGERSNFSGSGEGGERRSYNGGERRPYRPQGDRPYGERRSYNGGERSNFSGGEGGERRSYNGGERKPFRPQGDRPYGERRSYNGGQKSFGGQKPYKKKYVPQFNEADEAGIDMMISRRPQLDAQYSDNDYARTEIQEEIRLNKYIANSGVCSRREADTFIQAGVVTVNGEVVTELGTKVNVLTDDVRFNGERLKGEEKVYIVMNKPKGFVTTASDPHAEKTVMDLLKNCPTRVFPVGRLDKNTTGVLMFTNDGEIAERLTHPSYDKKKIYQVILDHALTEEHYNQILQGVTLTDGEVAADELQFIDAEDHRKLGIEIHSGKNRIVRRIFESLGYEVRALDRVYFAGLTKKGVSKGEWRYLTEGEVNILKMGAYV